MKHKYPETRQTRCTDLMCASSIVRYQHDKSRFAARLRIGPTGAWNHVGVFDSVREASEAILIRFNRDAKFYPDGER